MWRIGHRGACGYAPENTLLSMQKALELGVDGIEFDVQMSKDGVPVVIHDETLERTTSGKGHVSDYSLQELQTLDAGKGEKIPSLRDLLNMVASRCHLFIELKTTHAAQPVAAIIQEYVQKGWVYEQLLVCSFDHGQILGIRKINNNIQTCALIEGIPVRLAEIASDAGAGALNPYIGSLNQALVDDAHQRGIKVFTWTANTPQDIAKAKQLGVDGIISDFPDRL